MKNLQDLYDFIDRAAKSHKYPDNTAWALKGALKKFEPILNEEEKASVSKIRENLAPLTQKLFNRDKNSSASSLDTYRKRLSKLLGDFEKYGSDATKMASWSVKTVIRKKREEKAKNGKERMGDVGQDGGVDVTSSGMARIELPLRPNMKFVLIVPHDITAHERTVITSLLDSLNPTSKA